MRRISLVASLLVIHAAALCVEARSVLNFPRLSFEQNTLTGIAIVNPTDQMAVVTLTAYGADGRLLSGSGFQNPVQITIGSRQQIAQLTSQLFGAGLDPSTVAWFQATSSVDGLVGFFLFLNGSITIFDGADLPDSAPKIVFNLIRIEPGYSTEINIVNPGDGAATLELRLAGAGPSQLVRALTLAAKGAVRLDPASFFGVSSVSPGAYLIVSSNVDVAGFEFVRTANGDLLGLNARNGSEQLSELNFPQMAVLGPWKTEVGVLNYSTGQAAVTITAFKADGTSYATPDVRNNPVNRTLDGGGSLREDVEAMFGFTGTRALDGWIKVQSSAAALNGYVTYGMPSIGSLAAVAGSGQGRTRAIFSHIATAQNYFTGVAVLDAGSSVANVRVLAIRPDGQVLGSFDTTLQPRQRISKLIDELIPQAAGQAGGLIWVKSDVPVNLTSLFGTSSGTVLANIPAQPALDSYNPDSGPVADLSVSKTGAPNPVIVGNNLTYTVTVTNNGPSAATAVALTDSLPAGVTFVSANATQGSCGQSSGTVTCNLGTLANNAVATVTIIVTPTAAGTITNTAGVKGSEADPNMANNTASATTTVNTANSADLSIAKTGSPNPVAVNSNLSYLITVTNGGPSPATGVTVTDTLPAGVTFVSATPTQGTCSNVAGTVTCNLGSLPLGALARVTIVITPGSTGTISNTAAVSSNETDPNMANNTVTTATTVAPSTDLRITSHTNPGSCSVPCNSVAFNITVNNAGPATAPGVTLTDTLPLDPAGSGATIATFIASSSSSSCVSSGAGRTVTCNLGSIASGGNVTVNVTVSIDDTAQGRNITNNASVSSGAGTVDPNPTNNALGSTMPVFPTNIVMDLGVALVSSSPASGTTNQTFTYTFSVTNAGPSSSQNVTFTIPLAAGANFFSGSFTGSDGASGGCPSSGTTITCGLGTMRKGVSRTVTISTRFSSTGVKTSTATVSFGSQSGGLTGGTALDPNSGNNTSSVTSTVN